MQELKKQILEIVKNKSNCDAMDIYLRTSKDSNTNTAIDELLEEGKLKKQFNPDEIIKITYTTV